MAATRAIAAARSGAFPVVSLQELHPPSEAVTSPQGEAGAVTP
jgi:hypothetical protein